LADHNGFTSSRPHCKSGSLRHRANGKARIPDFTDDNIRAVLSVADHPKAASADPNVFYDNRFLKELEDSGFIKELYGRR
jgi:hypothetical protein